MRRLRTYIPLGLLLGFFGILTLGSRPLSLTSDEPAHIASGYALLARGRAAFWILPQHGHPPLLNVLESILVYLEKPAIPLEHLDGWPLWMTNYVRAFTPYLMPMERTEVVTRIPVIWLTVLLGALVFRWGKELGNYSSGLIALVACCFDPTLLAHGRLATTDVGTITLGTSSLYLAWRWLRFPSWGKAVGLGGLLGLTMLAKGSGLIWTAVAGLFILWKMAKEPAKRMVWLLQGLSVGLLAFLVLWAGYAFTWGPIRDGFGAYPAPDHWNGLISQALSVEKRWVFALGLQKHGNWWWYFPLAFLIKNPLPLLLGLGIGGMYLLRRPLSLRLFALGIFPVVYALIVVKEGMNIGYRHMLPVHPFIYLIIGEGFRLFTTSGRFWRRIVVSALGLWYIAGVVRMFPYEIAYFNELIGGPRNGHHYLVDSNIDWGQGYKSLRRYLDEHPGPVPKIAYHFINILPHYYAISGEALPPEIIAPPLTAPFHPLPGRYVISITALQRGWPEDPHMYAWFRQVKPTAEVGFSFFVYDISPSPLKWIAQCNAPAIPLSERVVAYGFGQADLRQIEFDCTAGWVYPFGVMEPGVYALHNDLMGGRRRQFPSLLLSSPLPHDPFIVRRLSAARLSVDMNRYTPEYPAFVLYEQKQPSPLPDVPSAVPASAEASPEFGTTPANAPIPLEGPLAFLGANGVREGADLDVETWWQVTEGPILRPFSIMGHLLSRDGQVLGQADGLAVSPVELLPGDIIVQRHRFSGVTDQEFVLRTGAYWLDTMERWSVVHTPEADVLWVPLQGQVSP